MVADLMPQLYPIAQPLRRQAVASELLKRQTDWDNSELWSKVSDKTMAGDVRKFLTHPPTTSTGQRPYTVIVTAHDHAYVRVE